MSNDEKIFNLMEKMYVEFSNRFEKLEQGQISLEQGQSSLEQGQKSLEQGQRSLSQSLARIEHDHGEKLSVLFDGYKQHEVRFDRIDKRFDRLEKKIDGIFEVVAKHEVQIKLIR